MVADCESDCETLTAGLSGPWGEGACCHYCWGPLPGNRCCVSNAASKSLLLTSLTKVSEFSIQSLEKLAANKWGSISDCVMRLSPGVLINNIIRQAFRRSLASPQDLARLHQLIADEAAQVAAADAAGAEHTSANAFRVLRGKRILDAQAFFEHPNTGFLILAFAVTSVPIDKLFNTLFEAEAFAKSDGGRRGEAERGPVGLLQAMANPTGILLDVHQMMAHDLFSPDSPLRQLLHIARANLIEAGGGIRLSRSLGLRLSASFRYRFLGLFRSDHAMEMIQMMNECLEDQLGRMRRFVEPQLHEKVCPKCEGKFLLKLRERLNAEPLLSLEEKLDVVLEIFEGITEDPFIASQHEVEVLHADCRAVCARSMERRKRLPVSVFSCQALRRWSTLHKARTGKRHRPADTVKKHMTKKKNKYSRATTGQNVYARDQNAIRTFVAPPPPHP